MSLTATNAQVYKGTAAVTYGSGSGVSGSQLQGSATITYGGAPTDVLLMHCDGLNGSATFTDSSIYNQTIVNAGNVVISTASKQFGTGSFYTNGSVGNYYLSVTSSALMFGSANFTIEFWMNPSDATSVVRNQRMMGNLPLGLYNSGAWAMGFNTGDGGKFHIDINNVGTLTATTAMVSGTWYHIALVRSGSTWYFFQNGVQQATATSTASFDNGGTARPVYIGWSGYSTTSANEYYNGYIDEIRFTNGIALYTSGFTVPTAPFTPLYTTATALVTNSGNYMKLPTSDPTNFDPSTSNVFVEAWVYWNGTNTWNSPNGGTIYERDNGTTQDFGMYTNSSGQLTAYMYTQNGNILRPIYNTVLSIQTWYHVTFAYNTVNQTAYIWVNGNIGTTSTASNPARYTGSSIYTSIGASPLNGVTNYFWNGYIRDLRVVKGGVIPTTSFTPVAAPFGFGVPPYISGGSTIFSLYTQYFYPSWLSLPGTTGSYMNLGSLVPTNFDFRSQNLFVEAWVLINSYASGAAQVIINRVNPVGTTYLNLDWVFYIDLDSKCKFHTVSGASVTVATHPTVIPVSKWTHVAASYNSSTNSVILFVAGSPNTSTTLIASPQFDSTKATLVGMGAGGNYLLNGYIQDLRVVSGGSIPTTSFTPVTAPFSTASPTYVSGMGTTVLALASQYFQKNYSNTLTSSTTTTSGGNTVTTIGTQKIHTFTTVGTQTFTVSGGVANAQIGRASCRERV